MDLMVGTVVAKGKKKNVLEMFNDLEDYYDKSMIHESGTDDKYKIEFEFSSRLISFLSYDYFQGYSEGYECHIKTKMFAEGAMDDEEEAMILEYKNGKIIHGLTEYGLDGVDNF